MTTIRRLRPLALALALSLLPPALRADPAALHNALQLAASGDWPEALAVAPEGVARDIVLWSMLREGEGRLGDYEDFLHRRPDWPGLQLLKEKGEAAAARSETPTRVIAYFGADLPRTAAGAIALVRALKAEGRDDAAETEAMRAWAELAFTAAEGDALRAPYPAAVARADRARLETLLWQGRRAEAQALLARLPADVQALARARLGLQAGEKGAAALVAAVPESARADPGLLCDRFLYRMRRDDYDGAAELLLSVPPAGLGRPEAWAPRRAILARWLMRHGRAAEALRVAASHGLAEGAERDDLEFLAGFIALRKLGDAQAALVHFGNIAATATTPISRARAAYWLGRAEEAAGRREAAEAQFRKAAGLQTSYYGLLAAERLGLPLDPALLAAPGAGDWRKASFAGSSVLAAGRLLAAAGERALARRFLAHLAEGLGAADQGALAAMALDMGEPHLALVIAKQAAARGVILPGAYFPVPDFVPDGLAVSRALALAIARRESEFDPAARSSANAQGLMQVLPETAGRVARRLGLTYAAGRLTTDPAFNVTIGAAYLATMVEEFGPSVALVAAGYNAGPGRPRRWIGEFGDPRRPDVDVVDWVETIPFAETRTYVMRVAEGLVIYRALLRGRTGPIRLTAELKG